MIFPHLERLTQKGWWTVGSQPAVNGAPSTDEVVGWGPKGGYVYQKCFVEFFAEEEDVTKIEKKVAEEGMGWVDYFAANLEVSYFDVVLVFTQSLKCLSRVIVGRMYLMEVVML